MKTRLLILFMLNTVICYSQRTNYPSVLHKSSNEIGIESINLTEKYTEILLTISVESEYEFRSISSKMKISDYFNSNITYTIIEVENNNLDERYRLKIGKTRLKLIFPKIAPGIETLNIFEDVPDNYNPYKLFKVKISNPDNSPKTNFTFESLKYEWKQKGIKQTEGIYEEVDSRNNIKNKVGIKKTDSGYSIIYLSGAENTTWKEGDIKAFLTETATENLFKTKWYTWNKSICNDAYVKIEEGSFKILFTGENVDFLYLKLYPTVSDLQKEYKSSGTGFALSNDGLIVTNFHVIENAKIIKISGIDGDFNKKIIAQVVASDKTNDLAILKITDENFKSLSNIPYVIKSKNAGVGTQVNVLGYPLRASMGDEIKLTNGIISSNSGFQGDITSYQISAPLQPGNSGGPLFDNEGNIIGIVNSKHMGAENASYAIKSVYLFNLVDSLSKPIKTQKQNLLVGKTLTQKVNIMKKFIYIIEVN